jgi:NADH dehydrogenase FAD-containing subunit
MGHSYESNYAIEKPRIIIVGAGFGGLFCAKDLKNVDAHITLIDRQNYHLFQPLLYQVATGFLGMNDVALPIRSMFRSQPNIDIIMAEVSGLNTTKRCVLTSNGNYPYDYLVLATGARYHFFGHESWSEHVQVLKTLEDAIGVRQRILRSFEQAEWEKDPEKRKELLTYIIIGGGPTGVEMAGAIADAINYAFKREFHHIEPADTRIMILESAPTILGGMPQNLSLYARRVLGEKGVRIECNITVKDIKSGCVITDKGTFCSQMILWAAGVRPLPISDWINIEPDKRGAIPVLDDLSIIGHRDIFAIGDAATVMQDGKPLPALAAVARQEGIYLAQLLKHRLNRKPYKSFYYRNYGTMATIGRNEAIADFGWITLKGWIAWVIWGLVHIFFLTGFRNRTVVFFTWLWTYLTYGMGARILIENIPSPIFSMTSSEESMSPPPSPAYDEKRKAAEYGNTLNQLQHDIDTGKTYDKVAAPDPAAAPLGTDDEAAGTSPDPKLVKETRERETNRIPLRKKKRLLPF